MKFEVHLTLKNLLSVVIGLCVVGLAVIPITVPAEHLRWMRWEISIFALVVIATIAVCCQAAMQSREDHKRDQRDRERDEKDKQRDERDQQMLQLIQKLSVGTGTIAAAVVTETRVESVPSPPVPPVVDGEIYRVVTSGKSAVAGMVRDIYVMQNREKEFLFDADVLVEMYAVNTSTETRFIKDFVGTVKIDGKVIQLVRQLDFDAWDFNSIDYEYCLNMTSPEDHAADDLKPLKPAFKPFPFELKPREPIDGWVHFVAKDVDLEKLSKNETYRFTFIDSLGEEILFAKPSATKRPGHIDVCRKGQVSKQQV